jgi:hypothetical protein
MSNVELEFDESFVANVAKGKGPGPGEYPFVDKSGKQHMIRCVPAEFMTGLTEQVGGKKWMGIVAPASRKGGLITHYTADELRLTAKQMLAMADYIERENGGNGR